MIRSTQVFDSEVVSCRLILGDFLNSSLSAARSDQDPAAAATHVQSLQVQQEYCQSCVLGSSREKDLWIMDRTSTGTYLQTVVNNCGTGQL